MKRSALTCLSLIAVIGLTACETVKGAGRDVQNLGNAVTNTAEKADG